MVNAVLEENKILIKELSKIENANRQCDKQCSYKCTLEKLNYDETADEKTSSYRKFCKQNTTTIEDDCEKAMEFVYCLHREVQNEINKIRDDCVEKHGADMQAYRMESLENLVEKQSYACFMFCLQKNTGVMNDDMSFNFDEQKQNNPTIKAWIDDCAKASEKEKTKCSQAASRYYCLENKLRGN